MKCLIVLLLITLCVVNHVRCSSSTSRSKSSPDSNSEKESSEETSTGSSSKKESSEETSTGSSSNKESSEEASTESSSSSEDKKNRNGKCKSFMVTNSDGEEIPLNYFMCGNLKPCGKRLKCKMTKSKSCAGPEIRAANTNWKEANELEESCEVITVKAKSTSTEETSTGSSSSSASSEKSNKSRGKGKGKGNGKGKGRSNGKAHAWGTKIPKGTFYADPDVAPGGDRIIKYVERTG